jgi:hypothetical protein
MITPRSVSRLGRTGLSTPRRRSQPCRVRVSGAGIRWGASSTPSFMSSRARRGLTVILAFACR